MEVGSRIHVLLSAPFSHVHSCSIAANHDVAGGTRCVVRSLTEGVMVKSYAASPLAGHEGRLIGASRLLFTHTVGASVDVIATS